MLDDYKQRHRSRKSLASLHYELHKVDVDIHLDAKEKLALVRADKGEADYEM